jgi:GGDEF domain-containing protein
MEFYFRKDDAMALIKQDNDKELITLEGVNNVMLALLGYTGEDRLRSIPFGNFVGNKTRLLLKEQIEYKDDNHDLIDVMRRQREIILKTKEGKEITTPFKMVRAAAQDKHLWFRLIVKDERREREVEVLHQAISANLKGHEVLDEATGLVNAATFIKDLELAQHYHNSQNIGAACVSVRLDEYDAILSHGEIFGTRAIRHVANLLRQGLRDNDVIARIDEHAIGVLLVDVAPESLPVVVGRIRNLTQRDATFRIDAPALRHISVSYCYKAIPDDGTLDDMPMECLEALLDKPKETLLKA